jgi:hypothetical protein
MRKYKNFGIGLGLFVLGLLLGVSVFLSGNRTAYAQSASQTAANLANTWCKSDEGKNKAPQEDQCIKGFKAGYLNQSEDSACPLLPPAGARNSSCSQGYDEGHAQANPDKSKYPTQCAGWNEASELEACAVGVSAKNNFLDNNVCNKYKDAGSTKPKTACLGGYNNTSPEISDDMKATCKDYGPDGSAPSHGQTLQTACYHGYIQGQAGKNQGEACGIYVDPSDTQKACIAGFNAGKASQGDDTSDCVTNGSTTFEWLLCPLTTALSKSAEAMNGFIENQLNFSSKDFLPEAGGNNGVYKAWSLIKNLVTSVLIILLLVMVISQAIGTSVFEAYTIRKVLPKLLIAVVAMQLSWELCKFAIDFANDLGNGVANLITAPFGGAGNMDLSSLLGRLSGALAIGTNVAGLGAAIIAGVLAIGNPAGAALIAFSVILSVLIALATILFRNVIIIACVMLSPLAILLWVLPMKGIQTYWNLWRENFTKALLLFPLMAAVIYTGRVFAWIVGGLDNWPGFIALLMVLVGFFGPYFLLPSMFKRGGSLMSQASNAINKGGSTLGKKPKEYLGERSKQWKDLRRTQAAERVNEGRPSILRGDQFRSGQWDPLLGGRNSPIRRRAFNAFVAKAVGQEEEEVKEATQRAQHVIDSIHPEDQDDYARALASGQRGRLENGRLMYRTDASGNVQFMDESGSILSRIQRDESGNRVVRDARGNLTALNAAGAAVPINGRVSTHHWEDAAGARAAPTGATEAQVESEGTASLNEMQAGLNEAARLGGEGNIAYIQRRFNQVMSGVDAGGNALTPEQHEEQIAMMNKFTKNNISSLFPKLPHLFKNSDYATSHDVNRTVTGLTAKNVAALSAAGMDAMVDTLEVRVRDAAARGVDDPEARTDLARLVAVYHQAASDPTISGEISADINRRMRRLAANMPPAAPAGTADPLADIQDVTVDIQSRVSDTGVIRDPRGAPTPAGPITLGQHLANRGEVSDFEVHDTVQRMGGWSAPALRDGDIIEIYNSREGDVKAAAEAELRRRGRLS